MPIRRRSPITKRDLEEAEAHINEGSVLPEGYKVHITWTGGNSQYRALHLKQGSNQICDLITRALTTREAYEAAMVCEGSHDAMVTAWKDAGFKALKELRKSIADRVTVKSRTVSSPSGWSITFTPKTATLRRDGTFKARSKTPDWENLVKLISFFK